MLLLQLRFILTNHELKMKDDQLRQQDTHLHHLHQENQQLNNKLQQHDSYIQQLHSHIQATHTHVPPPSQSQSAQCLHSVSAIELIIRHFKTNRYLSESEFNALTPIQLMQDLRL